MKILILALALIACGKDHKEQDAPNPPTAFVDAYDQVLIDLKTSSDVATGWPSAVNCDGTLWAGLAKAGGSDANLNLAEYEPGQIHRRPRVNPCWTKEAGDVGSKSTVSRDMIVGYMWARWAENDLPALQRLADYGASHGWEMGLPTSQPEIDLGDNLKGVLCRAVFQLSAGDDDRPCKDKGSTYLPVFQDYEKHIQDLTILLDGEVTPGLALDVDGNAFSALDRNAGGSPSDGLFQAARAVYTGDYSGAISLLEDSAYVCPTYVRGAANYCLVHRAFAMALVIRHSKESDQ